MKDLNSIFKGDVFCLAWSERSELWTENRKATNYATNVTDLLKVAVMLQLRAGIQNFTFCSLGSTTSALTSRSSRAFFG